jgi:OHCU decarboxylase
MIRLKESDLLQCCGSTQWASTMAAHSFPNVKEVFATGDSIWWGLATEDWLEAFRAHPRIGERSPMEWLRLELGGARHASEETLTELRDLSRVYEERFGHIFVILANGKSAAAIVENLRQRVKNDPETELRVSAGEQLQITHLRLKRILANLK